MRSLNLRKDGRGSLDMWRDSENDLMKVEETRNGWRACEDLMRWSIEMR